MKLPHENFLRTPLLSKLVFKNLRHLYYSTKLARNTDNDKLFMFQ